MITIMRKLINNNAYKVILWIFLFMMAAGSGLVFMGGKTEEKNSVIKVYDLTISDKKFALMLQRTKQQLEMFKMRGFNLSNMNVQKETVQAGVSKLLSEHAVDDLNLKVSTNRVSQEISRQLQHLPAHFFDENGNLNTEAFLKAIAPMTMQDFMSEIEIDSKNKVLDTLINASLYIPSFEKILYEQAEYADKDYSYFKISSEKYLSKVSENKPSDALLTKFYKRPEISEQFKTTEKRSGKQWVFTPRSYGITITDSEVKSFYDKNKAALYVVSPAQMQIRELVILIEPGKENEAKARIQELKQEADKNPSKFEEMVKKFSEDKATASKGGLSELFTKDDKKMNKTVVDTAFEFLGTDDQVSSPIKTDRGYELLQRVKKVSAKYKELTTVSNDIKDQLTIDKFKKRFAQDASRVIHSVKYKPEALSNFVEKYHGKLVDIPLSERKPGIIHTTLFRMEQDRYTQIFDKNDGIILYCQEIEKSTLPALENVKSRLLPLYFKDLAYEMMQSQLNQALKEASKESFEKVAEKYGVSVQRAFFKYNQGKLEQSSILKEENIMAQVKNLQYQGAVAAITTTTDGILMRLDSINMTQITKEEQEQAQKVMNYIKSYQYKEGFVASLYRIAKLRNKIEIKKEILQFTKEV
ncbi:peptidylprolyl isomerase [Candidatus Dependentiae bacterium]|nr:peptidylprolyl isomerase [Candidatus Dependentiae bacterium]